MKSLMKTRTSPALGAPRRIARLIVAVAFAGMLSAACDGHSPTAPGSAASITVTPNATLDINGTQQFTAVAKNAAGEIVSIAPTWSVAAGGGVINNTGLFTAGPAYGTFTNTVHASIGELAGAATVVVTALTPSASSVVLGSTGTYGILAGSTVTCVTGGLVKADVGVWPGSAIAGFGPCAATGALHTADANAQAAQGDLTAAYNQAAGTACLPANVMTGQDLGGKTLAPGVYCFTSSAPLTGTLTLAGPASGTWVFQMASTLVTATNSAVVLSGGASADNVFWQVGSSATIEVGTAMQGNILALASISIKDNATLIGRALARNGAVTLGSNNVIALPGSGVTIGSLASIMVSPNPDTLCTGGKQQFTAVGKDAAGNIVPITPTWSAGGAGTITSTGLFTAGTMPGNWSDAASATSGGITGYAKVKVKDCASPPPPPATGTLATITLTPNPDTLLINETQQFMAVGKDAAGNVVPISPTWLVVHGGGQITQTGFFTAGTLPTLGINTIQATSGGIAGYATVKVKHGPLATITVTPNPSTVCFNGTQQFTAVGKDAGGNIIAISPAWSAGATGTISNTGQFTAGTMAGTDGAKATSGGITGSAAITVKDCSSPPSSSDTTLGAAGLYGILAGTTVTCINQGVVLGDVGLWPGSAITGFPPCQSSPAPHAADDAAKAAQDALTAAYIRLNGLPCVNSLSADLAGQTLKPGVYCGLAVGLTGEVFFDALGDPNATFVIQAGSTLTTAGAKVTLLNNAQARNIFWVVGSSATVGVGSALKGNILALTSISIKDNATLVGRALARNGAVTLDTNNSVTLP